MKKNPKKIDPKKTYREVTIRLGEKSSRSFDDLLKKTGLSKTQAMQNALSMYDFLLSEEGEGRELRVYDPQNDTFRKVEIPQ